MNPNQPLIDKGVPFVLAVAGGGSQVIGELLRHGGMSGCLLAAHVLQDRRATDTYLGYAPDGYASEAAARALAVRAYEDVRGMSDAPHAFGIGVASSLGCPGERAGRRHAVHVAVQSSAYTKVNSYELRAERTRAEEESLASLLAQRAVWLASRLWPADVPLDPADTSLGRVKGAEPGWEGLLGVTPARVGPSPTSLVLSSSCNPFHDQHAAMMRWAHGRYDLRVDVELCVRNADKPPLDYVEISDRCEATRLGLLGEPSFSGLVLTNVGTYALKSLIFPRLTTFLVGTDTIRRVNDPQYYAPRGVGDAAAVMARQGTRFLVFDRAGVDFSPAELDPALRGRCTFVTAADGFAPSPLSSTQLRKEARRAQA